MKNFFNMAMIAGLLTLSSFGVAQQTQQPQHTTSGSSDFEPVVIENGSLLYAELSKSVDAKKVKVGDPITAQLSADVVSHGEIIVPRNSRLMGHVTEAKPFSKEDKDPESRLGIVFEKAVLKGGREVPFSSILMSLRPPREGPTVGQDPSSIETQRNTPIIGAQPQRRRSRLRPSLTGDSQATTNKTGSEIQGLTLSASGNGESKTIVSQKHTVKLESGVILELRVTGKY